MYLEDFEEIVYKLETDYKESEEFLESLRKVDGFLCDFVNENVYSNNLYFQNQFLLKKLLGEDLYDWVSWYLYELPCFYEENVSNCSVEGVKYAVTDLQSFIKFAEHGLGLPRKPKYDIGV